MRRDPDHDQRPVFGLSPAMHGLVWGALVALVLLLIALSQTYAGKNVWQSWAESDGWRRHTYAERIYVDDLFRTRANTWSNLAYVLVGFYAVALGCRDRRKSPDPDGAYVAQTPVLSILFGLACCYLGFGSGVFHASLTRWGQQLDVASMYAPLLACIAINLGRWTGQIKGAPVPASARVWLALTGFVVVSSFVLYRYKWSMSAGVVLPTLILVVGLFGVADFAFARGRMSFRWLLLATLTVVAARICWLVDVAGKFSGPDAWLQGHAVWHVLTAASLACIYGYYRSEVIPISATARASAEC